MQSTCSVESCNRKHSCRGFCAAHYERFKRTGSPYRPCAQCRDELPLGHHGKSKVCLACRESATCSVAGCGSPVKTKGMCAPHYARWANSGTPYRPCSKCGADLPFTAPANAKLCNDCKKTCSVSGCPKPVRARGLCDSHYSRLRKSGGLDRKCRGCGSEIPVTVANGVRYCSDECRPLCGIDGCQERVKASGLCDAHYKRVEKNGDHSRSCRTCGAQFPAGMDSGRKYCSEECVPSCVINGCNDRAVNNSYCSRHASQKKKYGFVPSLDYTCGVCGKKVMRSHAERGAKRSRRTCPDCSARFHHGYEWFRESIYELGEATCGICCEPINLSAAWPDPESLSIDHIIPVSRGGDNSLHNLQASHLICNIKKGARLTIPKEGEVTLF